MKELSEKELSEVRGGSLETNAFDKYFGSYFVNIDLKKSHNKWLYKFL